MHDLQAGKISTRHLVHLNLTVPPLLSDHACNCCPFSAVYPHHPTLCYPLRSIHLTFIILQIPATDPYQLVLYPKIDSLSSQLSGSNGGQTLVISGSGFNAVDCSTNVILLQGVPCIVTACTQTSLSCTVGPAPSQALGSGPYASSRGLLQRVYWNSGWGTIPSLVSSPKYPNSPDITRVQGDSLQGYCINCAYDYGQQLEGFFVPKVTTHYMFYIASDDSSDLYLSTDNTPANLTLIASAPWYMSNYWQYPAYQISSPILLQAGKPYFIRARHAQGGGGDFLTVAVRVMNPPPRSAAELTLHSVHDRQQITFSTTVFREIQQINFTAPVGQPLAGSFMFYLSIFGPRSIPVNINDTNVNDIAQAIAVGGWTCTMGLSWGFAFSLVFYIISEQCHFFSFHCKSLCLIVSGIVCSPVHLSFSHSLFLSFSPVILFAIVICVVHLFPLYVYSSVA